MDHEFGWKELLSTLYHRVILSYRSTLVGIAIALCDAALSYSQSVQLPSWAHTLVGILAAAFVLLKEKAGSRSPAGFVPLLALVAFSSSSCAVLKPAGQAALNCAETAAIQAAKDVGPAVLDALSGATDGWQAVLDRLRVSAGGAVVCALQAFIDQVEKQASTQGGAWQASYLTGPDRDVAVRYQRAKLYLSKNGF